MATDPLEIEALPPRFIVGIDFGTTNSAVAYVDTGADDWRVQIFPIPQVVAPGEVEARDTLPSFHYEPVNSEFSAEMLRLPWWNSRQGSENQRDHIVGLFARDHGAEAPGRLVASAKSWLCHTGVDRTAELLPWHAAADVQRLSPVEVGSRYLQHISQAWDSAHPDHPLAEQDVVLTLPASFDEVARELTVEAAARGGLPRVILIEEPQAAFYAWVYLHTGDWEQHISAGQKILVCDIGGGTCDFTLIRVRRDEDGKIRFHRVAVGDHLMLGGDNLDLALAYHLEPHLVGSDDKLAPRQFDVLVRRCQAMKETLLGDDPPERAGVTVPGAGAKLIGGALTTEITREDAHRLLLDGFFPEVSVSERPSSRASGFQEFGLPYASDPSVTRHLAGFLMNHGSVNQTEPTTADHHPARPDIVLFNGGLFESSAIRARMTEVIANWFSDEDQSWAPMVLKNDNLALAVARGAAYYGMVRRGVGVSISAELARSYYVGIESDPPQAVCLMPARAKPGEDIHLADPSFELLVDQPVEFPLLVSSTRLVDEPGEIVGIDREQMRPLPPIRTVLQVRSRRERGSAHVHLHAQLSEIGTLQLWCNDVAQSRRWRLEFDIRSATDTDIDSHQGAGETRGVVDEAAAQAANQVILSVFGPAGRAKPAGLVKKLSQVLETSRWNWPPSLLRRMWETLIEIAPAERVSRSHESRWLNLLGFALRPGRGMALDDWRVAETWRLLYGKVTLGPESMILWRRIAAGLSAGQQRALADPQLARIRGLHRRMMTGRAGSSDIPLSPQESIEVWRLLGSLELLPVSMKVSLGEMILDLMAKPKMRPVRDALAWTLSRLGSRRPLYGPLNVVVPTDTVSKWLTRVLQQSDGHSIDLLVVMQMARLTDDRYRDIGAAQRRQVLTWLGENRAGEQYQRLVREGGQLDDEQQQQVYGEALPKGLRLA